MAGEFSTLRLTPQTVFPPDAAIFFFGGRTVDQDQAYALTLEIAKDSRFACDPCRVIVEKYGRRVRLDFCAVRVARVDDGLFPGHGNGSAPWVYVHSAEEWAALLKWCTSG